MEALYDAVIITTQYRDYIMYFMCVLATVVINSAQFLTKQKHPLRRAFVAHTEPFGIVFIGQLIRKL